MSHLPQTERLYFREFAITDAALLLEMHQDQSITQYTGDPIPWDTIERVEEILRTTILPQYKRSIGRWAVYLKADDSFLGWCGLKDVNGEIDLGYRFIRQYWGKGYATEAAQAVLEYGIRNGWKNIVGRASLHNTASVNVLKKIGLIYLENYLEGTEESVKFVCDEAVFRNNP
jgi:[ribosomal protein S5]-alanine N-acetyltransferase